MAFANTSVLMEAYALKNICCQQICHHGESQLLPASLGESSRSAGESDPGSFQMTASAFGLRAHEILCALFKSGVSISHSPLALLKLSPTNL